MKIQKGPNQSPRSNTLRKLVNHPATDGAVKGGMAWLGGQLYPGVMIHELGHKWAIDALYQDGHATVEVFPLQGGATHWNSLAQPSWLGEQLSPSARRAVVSAAGTAMDVVTSMALFGGGYHLAKKHPRLGAGMMAHAGVTLLNSTFYAASGIGHAVGTLPGNDFLSLQGFAGIPCWVSALALASLLPAQYFLMKQLEKD